MKRAILLLTALQVLTLTARAVVTEIYNFNGLNLLIPDGNPAGVTSNQNIDSAIVSLDSVILTLNVSGTFNGDLYAYLAHDSGFTVLLNRSGRTTTDSFGYNDDGYNVTFDDTAPNGDIHTYRNTISPGPGIPLTDVWQPDGRNVDPDTVTNLTPRTAMLSSFQSLNADGDWTLFVADMSTGDTHTVQNWSMTISGSEIPEPGTLWLAAAGIVGLCIRRPRRRSAGV